MIYVGITPLKCHWCGHEFEYGHYGYSEIIQTKCPECTSIVKLKEDKFDKHKLEETDEDDN